MKRRKMLNILDRGTCHAPRDVHRNEEKSCDSVSPGSLSGISAHLWTDNCAVALTVLLLRWHGLLLSQPYYLLHSYLLPGCCISAPGRLLSHYLRFTQREPAVTRQSKQALMWIWCYAYGVATLSLCCCSGGTRPCLHAGTCDDLWGNLTLKRMQMKQQINIQRRSLIDLSRCKTISIDGINIQRRKAGTQNNTVSKTATRRWKQKENKSILMEAAQ